MRVKTMPYFDAILFDLDGTLIDSVADIAGAVNHVRAEMDMPRLPLEVVRTYIGDGVHTQRARAENEGPCCH